MAGESLYDVLNIDKDCSAAAIKKAYRTLSLTCHPDKNSDPEASKLFIDITKAYQILSDDEKRKLYDRTGSTTLAEFDDLDVAEALAACCEIYSGAQLKMSDIEAFFARKDESVAKDGFAPYERGDLLDAYKRHDGNMDKVMNAVPGAMKADMPRYVSFLEGEIKGGRLDRLGWFDATKAAKATPKRLGGKRKGGKKK
ncbi:DnaJ domain [Carpediemonas membranifera]|uniref:DnaJ domain n=1 Tax=Carpediemonas membranifera TaxID=201153 RepID=A0A8J6B4Y3_9EUKA|nr:DnaJ domain [Carpediemonas membranifera]|eukprot:KAG9392972.1 DnaJ domain [Carpediemonas membranifera]